MHKLQCAPFFSQKFPFLPLFSGYFHVSSFPPGRKNSSSRKKTNLPHTKIFQFCQLACNTISLSVSDGIIDSWLATLRKHQGVHERVIKVYALAPFLFGTVHQPDKWINFVIEQKMLDSACSDRWDGTVQHLSSVLSCTYCNAIGNVLLYVYH